MHTECSICIKDAGILAHLLSTTGGPHTYILGACAHADASTATVPSHARCIPCMHCDWDCDMTQLFQRPYMHDRSMQVPWGMLLLTSLK